MRFTSSLRAAISAIKRTLNRNLPVTPAKAQ
jgi:hypothetical protein